MKKVIKIGILVILMLQVLTTVALAKDPVWKITNRPVDGLERMADMFAQSRNSSMYSGGGAGVHKIC